MDVKPGHCWRCEKPLPARPVSCDRCPKAVYCQDECKQRDKFRHGAVECKMFGLKYCSHCKKAGNFKQCSGCNDAWYCSASCQRVNRRAHIKICKGIQVLIRKLVPELTVQREFINDSFYFGTTTASDFLRLEDNEWAGEPGCETSEAELTRGYHILSAGCGSLRNTVLTTASLPAKYRGKLHITLNDFDHFVMARNVLFLYMLGQYAESDTLPASLATIWYSVHIPEADYQLVKTSLQALKNVSSAAGLRDLTGGLVVVSDKDLDSLRFVWLGWFCLECEHKHRLSINLREQRHEVIDTDVNLNHENETFLLRQSSTKAASVNKMFQSGLFTPDEDQKDLAYDNPTLTKAEENGMFTYCVFSKSSLLRSWDSLRVEEYARDKSNPSVMTMYHAYVTHLLEKMKRLVIQKRLCITILVSNYTEIPQRHQTLKLDKYDRIFTSNLADYVRFRMLLKTLRPLMNVNNKNATIVTKIIVWATYLPKEKVAESVQPDKEATELCQKDTEIDMLSAAAISNNLEYRYILVPSFIAYFRARMMAGNHFAPSLDRIPSFKEAMQCEGMQMRDFRQELNKLVPFQYRINARRLTMLQPDERTLEWYILPVNKA